MKTLTAATPRKDRNNRRGLILKRAAELFAVQGYEATSMEQLSELTQLNKGTIYYYYKSKAAILFDMSFLVADSAIKRLSPALRMQYATDALADIVEVVVDWVVTNRNVVTTYFQESLYFQTIFSEEQFKSIREQQLFVVRAFYQIIEKGIKSGEFREVNVQITGRMIVGSLMWVYRWPDETLDAEAITRSLLSSFLDGLRHRDRAAAD